MNLTDLGGNGIRGIVADLSRVLEPVHALAALEVSLLNVNLSLGATSHTDAGPGDDNTRVVRPTGCRVGPTVPLCTFTLWLYDSTQPYGQPARVGGLVHGLELGNATGYSGRVPMVDNRDGSFNGTVNQSWVSRKGPHTFTFWLDGRDISDGLQWNAGVRCDTQPDPSACHVALRTVDFAPIACTDVHMHPDVVGGTCLCDIGFTLDSGGQSCRRLCVGATKVCCPAWICSRSELRVPYWGWYMRVR